MGRITIEFECVAKTSELEELERKIYDEVQKKRKEICEEENVAITDFYWSQYNIFPSNDYATVVVSCRRRSDFNDMSIEELKEELEELQEDLEDAEDDYEEIEDLSEDEYEDYDFESEEDYEEGLKELDIDIFLLKCDIELIEKVLEEKTK